MKVSVENVEGLKRTVKVSIPAEKVTEEVDKRLDKLSQTAELKGFRKGHVPKEVLKSRYLKALIMEVSGDLIQQTLPDAFDELELRPAGYPEVNLDVLEYGRDFEYSANVEVLPEVEIKELDKETVEIFETKVTDADVDKLIDKLREQHKNWQESDKEVADGDKVVIDFEGFIDGEVFEGGKAEDFELVVGSKNMIPGFEEKLLGGKPGTSFDIDVTFPENYHVETLKGKPSVFKINLKKVFKGELPELNDSFAEKFNIKEGGVEKLKEDIRNSMERELELKVSSINRGHVFDKLLEKNPVDLPESLVEEEIKIMKHEWFHRLFGKEHRDDEKIPDFPREMFEKPAKRRIHLGLLFSSYVKKHDLKVDEERVNQKIESISKAYEKPQELVDYYRNNPEKMAEIEALVMEEMVSETVLKDATVKNQQMDYEAVMNYQDKQEGDI